LLYVKDIEDIVVIKLKILFELEEFFNRRYYIVGDERN
jgi:hypothetical protein